MFIPWIVIGGITLLVAFGSFLIRPRDIPWATKLDRPKWLFFEPAIPLIWTTIFACGAWSAGLVWQQNPGNLRTWLLMGIYLLVEIVTVAYIPATLRLRSLAVGTILGGLGFALGAILALMVWDISQQAALLLLPYLIWSPIGTLTTRRMIDLNPEAA
ncbi:TspO/MBR family protein [Thermocoleostomius sinensis]|uniref:Tryptophan-rich sensory protein n=1 Tax=Thermocoleostomius sinensis A174 TaxID=2016057 RepID=A0A9E9CC17_9CYAN|nr:tryptophan-rich sensory protein [Thermocoleostomius sinensis]WAL61730.1 tryptophan-rich sensory protein [Thermocoleostomius sinensis A174]